MPSDFDVFKISGPVDHFTSIDWNSPDHQRIIMACLVQGTVILEKDREESRVCSEALAPSWWNPYNFECKEILKDDFDSSIFGCVFEFKYLDNSNSDHEAPRFVVAFRGTLPDFKHGFRDGLLDIGVIFGGVNKTSRFEKALEIVQNLVSDFQTSNIWIGGHSLGASIATITGKYMAKMDVHLKTFLFNPPFASFPLDLIPNLDRKIRESLDVFKTILKGGIAIFAKSHRKKSNETFSKIATWTPYLFVNPKDPISVSYIHYFEHRKKMEEKGMGFVGQFDSRISIREICSDFIGGGELSYLIPSASLRVNLMELSGWYEAHGIHQWWNPDINLQNYDYQIKQTSQDSHSFLGMNSWPILHNS